MEINADFTQLDHLNRENDVYAQLKYRLSLKWLKKSGIEDSTKLLNVGCGAGDFNVLAEAKGYSVDGIEPDVEALAIARKRCNAGSRLENVGIFDFKPTSTYRAVVMHDVLEHISDDSGAVRALSRLIASSDNSRLVISVPAHSWLFGLHDESLGHFRRYSKKRLIETLESEFDVLQVRYTGLLGIPAALIYSRLLRKPYPLGEPGLAGKILAASCFLEEFLPPPIGSSLLVLLRPKAR